MDYNAELLKDGRIQDCRNSLPKHETKTWDTRDPSKLQGIVFHQSLEERGHVSGVARYHVGPNHISSTGLPGLSYTMFVERSGDIVLANSVEARTLSQGNAEIAGDENAMYLAICFGGNFSGPGYIGTQTPTSGQLEAAYYLWTLCKKIWNLKNNQLFGHYDFGKPACPGYDLMKLIESVEVDWAGEKFNLGTIPGRLGALQQLGYYHGPIVGEWTIERKSALIEFQKAAGLVPDGVWGKKTTTAVLSALG